MKRPGMRKRNMLSLYISDEEVLYKSYIPFLKYGGLFIPTEKMYKLGDEVFILLTLLNDGDKSPVAGKVVWINPKGTSGSRPAGIGVEFGDIDKGVTRDKIEKLLSGLIADKTKAQRPTFTM